MWCGLIGEQVVKITFSRTPCSISDRTVFIKSIQWPKLEARQEQASLFFNKIHTSAFSIDSSKYLNPAPGLKQTRTSCGLQLT